MSMSLVVLLASVMAMAEPDRPALMSWDEYRTISHVAPYVLDITVGEGRLVYIGSRHVFDPERLDVRLIEALWSQVEPELAFNEGGDPPTYDDRDTAVRMAGEAGLVRYLAGRDDVPVAILDPTRAEVVAVLLDEYPAERLKLFQLLLAVKSHRDNPTEPFKERMALVLRHRSKVPGLENVPPQSLEELAESYEHEFPDAGSFRDVPSAWFDPVRTDTFLNDIARKSGVIRDEFMIELLTRHALAGRRVFAVVGASHVVVQERAIRWLLQKANK